MRRFESLSGVEAGDREREDSLATAAAGDEFIFHRIIVEAYDDMR